jgi:ketosteroid isomerase-like protein
MDTIAQRIIDLEKAALTLWGKGDPAGFLEISALDVVYFDPYVGRRVDGKEELTRYYQTFWGKVSFDHFELLNPNVQVSGEVAILTINYVSYKDEEPDWWNCTEVYRLTDGQWKIVQSHWSYTEVFKNKLDHYRKE